uniref:Uncharacterized protein n=1 Tax=Aegilops tauschii TaxID=37682 RepID=R7WEC8_AEGTA
MPERKPCFLLVLASTEGQNSFILEKGIKFITELVYSFLKALQYYSVIFGSLDATFPADLASWMKVEQCLLAMEICSVVVFEGAERVARHERLDRWHRIMEDHGFEVVLLSLAAGVQSQVLLGLYRW